MAIIRGMIEKPVENPSQLATDIVATGAALAIVRVPAGDMALPLALMANGLSPIHADTLVYYERDVSSPARQVKQDSTFLIEPAVESDRAVLLTLATEVFRKYRSHYHANPRLDSKIIADGYGEWATSCLVDSLELEQRKHETWVVRQYSRVVAFATCAIDGQNKNAEILLNAVDPCCERKGIYGSLLRHLVDTYHCRGLSTFQISTQVWNYTVQRAWVREGFLLTHAFDTYHVPMDNQLAASR